MAGTSYDVDLEHSVPERSISAPDATATSRMRLSEPPDEHVARPIPSSAFIASGGPSAPKTRSRQWNDEFQRLMERLMRGGGREKRGKRKGDNSDDEQEEAARALRQLCIEFSRIATDIGKCIINELFLPPEERTLPPITDSIGGVAGGEKYIHPEEGIFFKFAVRARCTWMREG